MNTQNKIESAYERKELFFKPWIGKQYEDGLLLKGDEKCRKVLLIGASRYCKCSLNKEKVRCPHRGSCIGMIKYDKLSSLKSSCAFVKSLNKNGELSDINKESILNHIRRAPIEKSYNRFENKFRRCLVGESKNELWNHVSFINYLQCIIDTINTPSRASSNKNTGQFDESKVIVEKTISILRPDIIILWGSSTIFRNMNINSRKEQSHSRLFSDCRRINSLVYDVIIEEKSYPLMLTNHHPYCPKFEIDDRVFSGFVEHVKGDWRGH